MTDSKPAAENGASAPNSAPKADTKPPKKPNPMWKYLGFGENFRPKLPSRNWSIFLAITGSFTAAVIYDKRETRRVQRKWCRLVEHVAKEPLDSKAMPRKLSVFLEGPPNDGLRTAQEHFKEYVKPILVASGLDWEFIQGRKEGDIRAELAEKIRKSRLPADQRGEDDVVETIRTNSGVTEFEGPRGDIVIGRHTWKEYVRGLHEGWLGPLTEPPKPEGSKLEEPKPEDSKPQDEPSPPTDAVSGSSPGPSIDTISDIISDEPSSTDETPKDDASPTAQPEPEPEPPKEEEKPKKPPQPSPFIPTTVYPTAPTPQNLPSEIPSNFISFPHILGFLNTPRRMYRFLNRRVLADQIGRETAAIILSTYRPYDASVPSTSTDFEEAEGEETQYNGEWAEVVTALQEEEKEWHKSVRVRKEEDGERTWLDPIVLDARIASRMRRFQLTAEEEERAKAIVVPEIEVEGWIKGGIRCAGKGIWGCMRPEKKGPVDVGDPDVDSQER